MAGRAVGPGAKHTSRDEKEGARFSLFPLHARQRGRPAAPSGARHRDRARGDDDAGAVSAPTMKRFDQRRRWLAAAASASAARALRAAFCRRRISRCRSVDVEPPHTPSACRVAIACSRHASATGQVAQIALASPASASDAGKKTDVSEPRHAASSYQPHRFEGGWHRDQP